jgi:hypothetical protein
MFVSHSDAEESVQVEDTVTEFVTMSFFVVRFEIFTAMTIQVMVFWVVIPCTDVVQ